MQNIEGPAEPKSSYIHRHQPLTKRETELMDWLVLGMTNQEIAHAMGISEKGVDAHIANIHFKVGLGRRVTLAIWWDRKKRDDLSTVKS